MIKKRLTYLSALILILWSVNGYSANYLSPDHARSLSGITGVYVAVEGIDDHALRAGLTAPSLISMAESVLAEIGVRALSQEEIMNIPGRPILMISVNAFVNRADTSYATEVSLNQFVVLYRDTKTLSHLPTWTLKTAGMASNYSAGNEIEHYIRVSLNELAKAYRGSN